MDKESNKNFWYLQFYDPVLKDDPIFNLITLTDKEYHRIKTLFQTTKLLLVIGVIFFLSISMPRFLLISTLLIYNFNLPASYIPTEVLFSTVITPALAFFTVVPGLALFPGISLTGPEKSGQALKSLIIDHKSVFKSLIKIHWALYIRNTVIALIIGYCLNLIITMAKFYNDGFPSDLELGPILASTLVDLVCACFMLVNFIFMAITISLLTLEKYSIENWFYSLTYGYWILVAALFWLASRMFITQPEILSDKAIVWIQQYWVFFTLLGALLSYYLAGRQVKKAVMPE